MRTRFTTFLLAVAGLLCASCVDSKNPLCDPLKAKTDAQLAGAWRAKMDDGGIEYYHVGPVRGNLPAGMMRAVSIVHKDDGTVARPGELLLFPTTIGKNHFLNVLAVEDKDLEQLDNSGWKPNLVKGFFIVKYQIQGDTLTVWGIDADAKGKAIEAGKIKGTVEKNTKMFTDTSEKLAAFLSAPENTKLFTEKPVRYERVK